MLHSYKAGKQTEEGRRHVFFSAFNTFQTVLRRGKLFSMGVSTSTVFWIAVGLCPSTSWLWRLKRTDTGTFTWMIDWTGGPAVMLCTSRDSISARDAKMMNKLICKAGSSTAQHLEAFQSARVRGHSTNCSPWRTAHHTCSIPHLALEDWNLIKTFPKTKIYSIAFWLVEWALSFCTLLYHL